MVVYQAITAVPIWTKATEKVVVVVAMEALVIMVVVAMVLVGTVVTIAAAQRQAQRQHIISSGDGRVAIVTT